MNVIKFSNQLTLQKVLFKLDKTKSKSLIFTDNNKNLLGSLTDGDIRRGLIRGISLNKSILNYLNKKPFFLTLKKFKQLNRKKVINLLREKKKLNIDIIPILNKKKKIVNVLTLEKFESLKKNRNSITQKVNKTPVVIMAGGKGLRLKPFTNSFPKILMPYGQTVAGEYIIKNFKKFNFSNFFISINHKKQLIKSYFKGDKNIKFLEEKKFLGTIGSLSLLEEENFTRDVVCINCDTIIKTNFNKIVEYHEKKNNDITIVVASKKYVIPYGYLESNKRTNNVSFKEKPEQFYLVNTGCYVFKKEIIKMIPTNKRYDINDLLKNKKIKAKKIGVFPISSENWKDIGSLKKNYL